MASVNKYRLRNLLKSSVKIENAPDTVDTTFMLDNLISEGYVVFCEVDNALRSLMGALSGVSPYAQPTEYVIANPVIKSSKVYKVGVDCAPLYATRERRTAPEVVKNIINTYAARLDKVDVSIDRAIINTRQVRVFTADTPQAYKSIENLITMEQNADKSATVIPSDILANVQAHFPQIKNQYVLDMLLRDKRAILSDFMVQFGIDSLPYEKKERMLTDEVDGNGDEVIISRNGFAGWIDEQLQEVNKIFGTNMKCSYVPVLNLKSIESEVETNGESDIQESVNGNDDNAQSPDVGD